MNNIQAQLVYLVSCSIRDKKAEETKLNNVDWNKLLECAQSHQVKGLIYSALPKDYNQNNIDKERLEEWKRETMLTALWQMRHISKISSILRKFNEHKISVIILKGLVIRKLYPRPELRTMCDADLLVKQSDLNKIKLLLESEAYIEGERSPIHISYFNDSNQSHIEVHWTIEDKRFFNVNSNVETEMWDCAEEIKVGECEVLSLSLEDLALHLCIHMAAHLLTSGFGIRQLCDLVLLVEKRGHLIDWTSFYNKGKQWGIERFIISIFLICEELFQMVIPSELVEYKSLTDKKLVNTLIDEIISGGTYGKKDLAHVFSHEFAYGIEEKQRGNLLGVIKRFLLLLFPPTHKLSDRYIYAKKYKVFMPFAWLHHLFLGILYTDYRVIDKLKFLKSSVYISIRRHKLLKRLDL